MDKELEKLFQRIVSSSKVPDKKVFVSLGSPWVRIHILEVDSGLTEEEKSAFLDWTVSQREGSRWSDTVAFYQRLSPRDGMIDLVFSCVAFENLVESLRKVLDAAGVEPIILEPSVSSVSRVVFGLHKGVLSRTMAVEPAGSTFVAYFYGHGQLRAVGKLRIESGGLHAVSIEGDHDLASDSLGDIETFWSGTDRDSDFRAFLVGEFTVSQLRKWKRGKLETQLFTIVDPFAELNTEKTQVPSCEHGSWFVDNLGLIQRGVEHA